MPLDLSLNPAPVTGAVRWRDLNAEKLDGGLAPSPPDAVEPLVPPWIRSNTDPAKGKKPPVAVATAAADTQARSTLASKPPVVPCDLTGGTVPILNSVLALPGETPHAAVGRFAAVLMEADTLVVPAGACFKGDLEAPCVHIKGTVHGKVLATKGPLIVDVGGVVFGSVESPGPLVIAGHVRVALRRGTSVWARGSLQLAGSARVSGDVRYVEIAIHHGARVRGTLFSM